MKYNLKTEHLPEKVFLVIKGYGFMYDPNFTPNANPDEDTWGIIQKQLSDGSVERLRKNAGSDIVYMLLCNTCVRNDEKKRYDVSYDIACEYLSGSEVADGFEIVRLKPCEYVVFDCDFDGEYTLSSAHEKPDDLFWGEWLRENPYTCEIDNPANWLGNGYASIELYSPFDPNIEKFNAKIWYPVKLKNEENPTV